jgi:hypothetical protein
MGYSSTAIAGSLNSQQIFLEEIYGDDRRPSLVPLFESSGRLRIGRGGSPPRPNSQFLQPASSFFWKGLGSAVCGTADCWCGCGGRKQRFRDLSCETGPLCAFVTPQAVALLVVNTAFGFLQWNIRLVPHYWLGLLRAYPSRGGGACDHHGAWCQQGIRRPFHGRRWGRRRNRWTVLDAAYRWFARHRYRWFGKPET